VYNSGISLSWKFEPDVFSHRRESKANWLDLTQICPYKTNYKKITKMDVTSENRLKPYISPSCFLKKEALVDENKKNAFI
jgi:hypothetical protein